MSAPSAIRSHPESAAYYHANAPEGTAHRQAIGAFGRRRINALWTMIQTRPPYRIRPAAIA